MEKRIPLNDLGIGTFIRLVIALSLAMFGLIGIAAIGFDIPILRQAIGFICLTFLPGICILRILKIHNLGTTKTLLYSVGLSLAFVMFAGVFINVLLPHVGISRPITTLPLTVAFTILVLMLAGVAYKRDQHFQSSEATCTGMKEWLSPPYLFLVLFPFLASLGALLVTFYQNNTLLLILIILIGITPILVAFGKFIPEKAYSFAIVMIGISLLLHTTLVSRYPMLWAVDGEYYFQNLVVTSGWWDPQHIAPVNSCLSITMLAPIYSAILNTDSIWLFKVIYQLIFSLVPLALFTVYAKQTTTKIAFLSAFFFMSVMYFYGAATLLRRQEIAWLFFALLILLMIDRKLNLSQRTVLSIVFSLSIVVSHYSVSYLYMIFLVTGCLFFVAMTSDFGIDLRRVVLKKLGRLNSVSSNLAGASYKSSMLSWHFVCLYLVLALSWYMYVASGASFNAVTMFGHHIYESLSEFANPVMKSSFVTTALGGGFLGASLLGKTFRILQYITQLFIIVGFVRIILRPGRYKTEYIAFITVAILILLSCIILPFVTIGMGMGRFYFTCLFLLSPLCITGGKVILEGVTGLTKKAWSSYRNQRQKHLLSINSHNVPASTESPISLKFLTLVVLVPYFLFSAGFIFDITGQGQEAIGTGNIPSSASLSHGKIDTPHYNQQEVICAQWLAGSKEDDVNAKVYGDAGYSYSLLSVWLYEQGRQQVREFGDERKDILKSSYIYFRTWNVERKEARISVKYERQTRTEYVSFQDNPDLLHILESRDKLYDNGGAQVLGPKIN